MDAVFLFEFVLFGVIIYLNIFHLEKKNRLLFFALKICFLI